MKKIIIFLSIFLQAGCAIGWSRPGGTEMELSLDRFTCEQQAARMYPRMMVQRQVGGGYLTPSRTECRGNENRSSCVTYPGQYVPPVFAFEDANAFNRNDAVSGCLRSMGYEFHMGFK
ncbi:MAG: putative lipoprotein [Herbaspirillum sp.]|jgi:hypothetical protein|nr:putative lipoprotein [Herbaspirillum sp.]